MKIYKIALGTTYRQKIDFFNEVLDEIGIKAQVFPVKAESGVPDQPKTFKETARGAMNRAKAAFKSTDKADFGAGIEVGYQKNKNGDYKMFCVTAVSDEKYSTSSVSGKLLLPGFHQKILAEDKYLGDFVVEYVEKAQTAEEKYLGTLIRTRVDFIKESSKYAILQYLNKK